jgi:hypothetical protein
VGTCGHRIGFDPYLLGHIWKRHGTELHHIAQLYASSG